MICKGEGAGCSPTVTPLPQPDPWAWQPPRPSRLQQPAVLIRLEGADTLRVLHGQTSQDLERARSGQCLATCCISPTGRLRALAEVLVDGTGAWLLVSAGDGGTVHQALDRVLFPADQVVLGAPLPVSLFTLLDPPGPLLAPLGQWQPLGAAGGSGGFLLPGGRLVLPDEAPEPEALQTLPALSAAEAERWRLQGGQPAAPGEINEDVNPFELGLAARVSLSKGCYVGQENLDKLATYDGVKQQLRRWLCTPPAGGPVPLPGGSLHTAAGDRAGRITSCLELPATAQQPACWLGLALVRRQALAEACLRAEGGLELELSIPEAFVAPPVGAGGGAGKL